LRFIFAIKFFRAAVDAAAHAHASALALAIADAAAFAIVPFHFDRYDCLANEDA
jgi:hypothetical protein